MSSKSTPKNGTIFIIDISGYTKFVRETERSKGILIISKLFETIMSANKLGFRVSEIEGDAILFYRFGKPYPVSILLNQFEAMLKKFNQKLADAEFNPENTIHLSIKAIAHYGEISEYSVFNFNKLYGKILIEAHRLLKNNIHEDTYVLITDQYFLGDSDYVHSASGGFQQCERYDIGKLCYTYFPYANKPVDCAT